MTGDDGLQRGSADAPQTVRHQEEEHHPALRRESKQHQPQRIQRQAQVNTLFISDLRIDHSRQPGLHAAHQHADYR